MRRDSPFTIRGPYEDGRYCLVEQIGDEYFGRGLLGSKAECQARHREILARRKAEKAGKGNRMTSRESV